MGPAANSENWRALSRAAAHEGTVDSRLHAADAERELDEILAALDELEALAAQIRDLRSESALAVQARRNEQLIQAISAIEESGDDPGSSDVVMRLIEDLDVDPGLVKSRLLKPVVERVEQLLETVRRFNALGRTLLLTSDVREAPGVATRVMQFNSRVSDVLAAVAGSFQDDVERGSRPRRVPIPKHVRHEVWRRDEGRCVDCGSRDRLEYDHIIPVAERGSNTARNVELRCEACNRRKGAAI